MNAMSVLLIGYRGSGKTTLGRALAIRVSWPFVDLDQRITERENKSIREIFQQHGEPYFRSVETTNLLEALQLKNHVISLGGGAVLAEENRNAIAVAGHPVVYLKADAAELHRRILADSITAEQRPSLTPLGGSVEEIRRLLETREPIYQAVKSAELNVQDKTIDEVVGELMRCLHLT